jgi:hypothetical protein
MTYMSADKENCILMLGLDAAGKKRILYKLKLREIVKTIPSIGFNVTSTSLSSKSFELLELAGVILASELMQQCFIVTLRLVG